MTIFNSVIRHHRLKITSKTTPSLLVLASVFVLHGCVDSGAGVVTDQQAVTPTINSSEQAGVPDDTDATSSEPEDSSPDADSIEPVGNGDADTADPVQTVTPPAQPGDSSTDQNPNAETTEETNDETGNETSPNTSDDPEPPVTVSVSNDAMLHSPQSRPVPLQTQAPLQPVYPVTGIPDNAPMLAPVVSIPTGLDTNTNRAPYFENLADQEVLAGQWLELRLIPRDPDGNVPGLFTGALPEGAQYNDNFDGTKTIRWRALEPDVGTFEIDVTAVDAEAPLYRTTQTVRVRVRMPEDRSTIINLPPGINEVRPHLVQAGDEVVLLVKATDPNGTVPTIEILNPPASYSFEILTEDENIRVLRWQTIVGEQGTRTFRFRATDAVDSSLSVVRDIEINIAGGDRFERQGSRLRDLAANRNFYLGYASLLAYYNRPDAGLYSRIATEEFNIMTTENSVKWGTVNPRPNEWKWEAFDTEMQLAFENDMVVHGHTLLWHRQLPEWVYNLPLADREQVMLDFITHVTARYGSHVALWDVVNEAFEEDGTYRNSVWYQSMGSGFIEKAFRQARITSPNSQLIYNDYDVAWEGPKADAMYNLVRDLLNSGVPIDGVGFQMHLKAGFDRYDSVRRNFSRFADLGLDIYITEFDVALNEGDSLEAQASTYQDILSICLENTACRAFQTWGFTDQYSWIRHQRPLLFDAEYQPKPAYRALQERLQR